MNQVNTIEEMNKIELFAKEKQKILLIKFGAKWCGPCKKLAPLIINIAEKQKKYIEVADVNIDEAKELCDLYKISAIPTCIIKGYAFTSGGSQDQPPEKEIIKGYKPEQIIKSLKAHFLDRNLKIKG